MSKISTFAKGVTTALFASTMFGATAFTSSAFAQEVTAEEADKQFKGWFKICEQDAQLKKEVCAVSFQIISDRGQPVASIRLVSVAGVERKIMNVIVPPGLLIQPGMRIQIDKANKGTAKFQICSPQACILEARLGKTIVSSMKRGKEMKIIGIAQDGKKISFPATLTGFTAAFDGKAVDPKVVARASETLQQRLQRRADEKRKQLLDKQKKEEN